MKLVEVVKVLMHAFRHNNTRPYSNTKDVLIHCKGSRSHESHIKHYLDMTQTQLYEMFKATDPMLDLPRVLRGGLN